MKFPEAYRLRSRGTSFETVPGETCRAFLIPSTKVGKFKTRPLQVIATDGVTPEGDTEWEHVSVSLSGRLKDGALPNWTEMCLVKELFWGAGECVVEFHPKKEHYVDVAAVLHLWKWTGGEFPTPPIHFV